MAKIKSVEDLYIHTLKDVLYAEKRILKALPKMAKKASTDALRQAFETHVEETEGQVERLEQVFDKIDRAPRGSKCEAILGIIEEAEELMEEVEDDQVRDAAMLAAAQAVEHYEIARYGTLCAMAKQLGYEDQAKILHETLAEEKKTDEKLSKLAESQVNKQAA